MNEGARSPSGRALALVSAGLVWIAAAVACAERAPPAPAALPASEPASPTRAVAAASAPRTPVPFRRCTAPIDRHDGGLEGGLDRGGPLVDMHDGGAVVTPQPSFVPVPDADAVIASLRAPFRRCYQHGLNEDRLMQGCVLISARITPEGRVQSNHTLVREGLSPEVDACLSAIVAHATFGAPGGNGSVLHIPITFIQEKK